MTEVEGNTCIQGVSNLFDYLKVECKKRYKDKITKVSKICEKTKQNDNKKVSTKPNANLYFGVKFRNSQPQGVHNRYYVIHIHTMLG